jgi:hypothetical protein
MIPLIDKFDNFEIVRDKVAEILAAETVSQQDLATTALLDPDDFKFDVYIERINPWDSVGSTPIVNVWFNRSPLDKGGSNSSTRQKHVSSINCDIYAQKETEETYDGHTSGDEAASKAAQRVARLVRNILMHDDYRLLNLTGVVWSRWVTEITMFQPTSGNQVIQHVVACRVALDVEHNEEMVFHDESNLIEGVNVKFYKEPDGLLRAELNYGTIEAP